MVQSRDRWSGRGFFILAAIGSAIGLGNFWRFPYVAYSSGGGAFLIPYFIALITAGIPLLMLEMSMGQMMQAGAPLTFRKINKKFEMIGWWALAVGATITFYYGVVMAWSFDYLWYSLKGLFTGVFPWAENPDTFFIQEHLQDSGSAGSISKLVWPIVIGLLLTWISVYWIIKKGVTRVGKVVLFTVPIPFLIIFILLISSLNLTGSANGISAYLYPDFAKLGDPNIWINAYGQVFFSLSVGFGLMYAYASYLPKKAEISNAATMTAFANCGTSFIAGFVVFSFLGYFAAVSASSVANVASAGPGLVFSVYPQAISLLPFGAAGNAGIAILLFLCLLTLGIDSLFSLVEGVATGLHDKFRLTKKQVTLILCVVSFFAGLWFATDAGLSWLDIVDKWINLSLVAVCIVTAYVVGWKWDIWKLVKHINSNSIIKVGRTWVFLIRWFIPILLLIILFGPPIPHVYEGGAIIKLILEGYGTFPQWALFVGGWLPTFLAVLVGYIFMKIPSKRYDELEEAETSPKKPSSSAKKAESAIKPKTPAKKITIKKKPSSKPKKDN